MTRGQTGVGRPVAAGQVVGFEDFELELFAESFAVRVQVVEGQREQLALPFALENLFRRFGGDRWLLDWLELDAASPLLAVRGGVLVGGESFDRHAEVGAERRLRRIETRKQIALQRGGEEALSQVLGVFVVFAKFHADEAIDRFPIQRAHAFQRLVRQRCAGTGGLQQRKLG